MKNLRAAYTLLEVLIAAAILMMAVAAAAALSLATVTQEETTARVSRCINLQEQAARLYQLGIAPNAIQNLLPPDPAVISVSADSQNLAIPSLGTVQQAHMQLVFTTTPLSTDAVAGTWNSGESSATARRTLQMTVIRPSLR